MVDIVEIERRLAEIEGFLRAVRHQFAESIRHEDSTIAYPKELQRKAITDEQRGALFISDDRLREMLKDIHAKQILLIARKTLLAEERSRLEALILNGDYESADVHPLRKKKGGVPKSLIEQTQLINDYVRACEIFKTVIPTLSNLAEISNCSISIWSIKLRDTGFLVPLRARLSRRRNYAKSESNRIFWDRTIAELDSRVIEIIHHKAKQEPTDPSNLNDWITARSSDRKRKGRPYVQPDDDEYAEEETSGNDEES
jgi:hypothetical protein